MNKIFCQLSLVLLLITGMPGLVHAQPAGAKKETIDGKEYYIHTVAKGETIYGISKTYKCSQDLIWKSNPGSEKGLDIGQKLKIPVQSKETSPVSVKNQEAEKKYLEFIKKADEQFVRKDYVLAKESYQSAIQIQPSSDYPKQKIAECDKMIQQQKTPIPSKDTEEYTVEKGETVYGISRKLKVSQEKILELNPEAKNGLKEGQKILLPKGTLGGKQEIKVVDPGKTEVKNVEPLLSEKGNGEIVLVEHPVQKGESLFGLSQKYKVSQDSIKLYNNGLTEGIKRGQTLVIPVSKTTAEKEGWKWYPDLRAIDNKNREEAIAVRKEVYEVGLLLPFYLDKNQSIMENKSPLSPLELYEPTRQSLDFYHGVLLALDSLRKFGLNINLRLYDTSRDSLKLSRIIQEPEFAKLDLIIGPTEMVEMVAKVAGEKKIPMVVPFGYTNKILLDNEFVAKAVTSTSYMVSASSRYIVKNYSKENIILLDGRGKKDEAAVKAYRKELNEGLASAGVKDTVKYFKTDNISSKGWVDKLSKDKINVLVVPSNDLSFVSSFFNTLQGTSLKHNYKEYRFAVFGTDEWLKYDDIEANLKVKFNVHVPSPVYVSYTDSLKAVPFILAFRSKFNTDPDKYAMMGFDLAWFYLSGYMREGKDFPMHLENYDVELVHTRFRFKKVNQGSGYLNTNVYVLKYQDYQLIKVE